MNSGSYLLGAVCLAMLVAIVAIGAASKFPERAPLDQVPSEDIPTPKLEMVVEMKEKGFEVVEIDAELGAIRFRPTQGDNRTGILIFEVSPISEIATDCPDFFIEDWGLEEALVRVDGEVVESVQEITDSGKLLKISFDLQLGKSTYFSVERVESQ